MTPIFYDPVALARQYAFVREAGQNRGQRVEAIQRWCGGQAGESWCMYFATMILDLAFQGAPPIPREGSCEAVHQLAIENDWVASTPSLGDLVLSVDATNFAHHVGIVSKVDPLMSIAGNTSADGASSNGDRVAEHAIDPTGKVFVHYPRAIVA